MLLDRTQDSRFAAAALAPSAAGQASALEKEVAKLFDQWRAPLLGYLITLRLPLQEGEEIVQEIFLSLFQHLLRGKSRENLRGWMFRVGHNLALKRRYSLEREAVQQREQGAWTEVPDLGPNPENALAMKQRLARLLAVVAALPEQDRCCLHLRAEGLRYREIAAVLGISLGSVAFALGRSLERLRRADGS